VTYRLPPAPSADDHEQGSEAEAVAADRPRVVPPAPSAIDLHTHSSRSDGVLPPATLLADAAAVGVRLLALTDHDTLAGVREVVAARGVPLGLELIPGVEINAVGAGRTRFGENEFHILGLFVRPDDEAFEAVLEGQRAQRRIRFERTLERLREIGLPVDAEAERLATSPDDALGRPTIGRLLVAAGHATSVQDAFTGLIGWGMPAYVPRAGLDPVGAIRAIRAAAGLPVLAHFWEAPERREVVRDLVDEGLAGLEVYYRAWDAETVAAVGAVAAELGLVPTGGSDYHGDTGPYAEAHAALWVPPEVAGAVLHA
jgi:predicted metal-dependent phosphoesterase TrpH